MSRRTFDLATEVGETFALPPCGLGLDLLSPLTNSRGQPLHPRHTAQRNDAALLDIVSTGYVACGAHSGDPVVMLKTMKDLAQRGITVGAHPSYPDIFNFGQTRPDGLAGDDLFAVLVAQLSSAVALARAVGTSVRTVKCHGALSFDIADQPETAETMARAVRHVAGDDDMALVFFAGAPGAEAARKAGVRVVREAYADRAYGRNGRIIDRRLPGALIEDPDQAVAQAMSIILRGRVVTIDGEEIDMQADSVCLHGDTPGSEIIASKLKEALKRAGIQVQSS